MGSSSGNITSALLCNDLPNPFTFMAFLPPHVAFQAKIAGFVVVCSLAVLIWDQLHTLSDDYVLAFQKRFRWPTAVYFVSRVSTLAFLVGKSIQMNSQTGNCELSIKMLDTLFFLSRASTSLLMYFRVCAVYNMNRVAVLFFGFTWLGVVAGAATAFGAMEAVYIRHTKYCLCMIKHLYVVATSVADFVNDTLILFAIMYKLGMAGIRRSPASQLPCAWKPMECPHLQSFTKAFLQDSQIYYTIAVALNFATIINFFAVNNNPGYNDSRFTMLFPNTTIVNIMACRVFRKVKLGHHSQVLVMPTQVDIGNLTQHDCESGEKGSHDTGDTNVSMSREFSSQKELSSLPTTNSHKLRMEKPSAHLEGVEVMTVIEVIHD